MANNNETTIENPFNTGDASKKKEKSPQPQPNYTDLVAVDNVQPNYADLVEVKKGVGGHLKDFGTSVASGAASLPDIAIGIGDLYSGGRAGKAIQDSGIYTPGSGSDYWRDKKSINAKSQQQQFDAAEGVIEKTKVALSNPSQITNAIGESLAPMVAGGLVGRGINIASKGKIGAAAAGALGEGTVMAGSQAESIRQETDDGLLTNGQVGAAVATGVAGSAFGYLGGRIAQKLGFDDIDNMMANGVRSATVQQAAKDIPFSSIPKSILAGAVSEGILEELPQSLSEQALQNIALGKDWYENLDSAAVMGTLAGMAMGGGINAYTSTKRYMGQERDENIDAQQQDANNPNLPMLPGGNTSLDGEFIPSDRGQATTEDQGRNTYEYDQFSTDADNLLGQGNGFNPMQGNSSENPDSLIVPTTPPLSRQLGINPKEGPLSGAAALAVDSGTTSAMLNAPAVTDTKQDEINNNAPLSNAAGLLNAPTENTSTSNSGQDESTLTSTTGDGSLRQTSDSQLRDESGLLSTTANSSRSESANDSSNNLERSGNSSVISNAIGNDGNDASGGINNVDSVSGIGEPSQVKQGQSDHNNVNTVGNNSVLSEENAGTATSSSTIGTDAGDSQSRTVEPILGADGQNKWFASQDKANAFVDKKNLGNDYQVVQDGKRFEIQPKSTAQNVQSTPQNEKLLQVSELETQLANEKSVPKKAKIFKQIAELQQGLNNQAQSEANLNTPQKATVENHRENFAKMDRGVEKVSVVRERMRAENPEIFTEENDHVRETHGLTNARVSEIVDQVNNSGAYELSDREYEKVKDNPNYKIDYDPKSFIGKVKAVKDQHSGEWVGLGDRANLDSTTTNIQKIAPQQAEKQSQVAELETQLANETSVIRKVRLRKQIADLQKDNIVDQAAHAAATSIQNDLPEPTQAQIEAGNYKKGHIKVHGLDISIENPKGSERRGTDPNGKEWTHTMSDHYGYIKRTIGADQENIDTYVGGNPDSEKIYVVDQIDQESGNFDEHKVMIGFDSQEDAVKAYSSNFDKGWKVGPVKEMSKDQFKDWLKNADTSKPVTPKTLKESIENISAEKIFQKDLNITIKSESEIGQKHFIPSHLMDTVHKLGDLVNDLASMRTEGVKANVPYAIKLLRNIAQLNPDVKIHIVSDLNKITDNSIRANLSAGGFFVPDQNTSYIYPKSDAWHSSILELLNHELVHAATAQSIDNDSISENSLNQLQKLKNQIDEFLMKNYEILSDNVIDRLNYATNMAFPHELFAVSLSESNIREVLRQVLDNNGLKILDAIFTKISTNQNQAELDEQSKNHSRDQQRVDRNGNFRRGKSGSSQGISELNNRIDEERISEAIQNPDIAGVSRPASGEAKTNAKNSTGIGRSKNTKRANANLGENSRSLNNTELEDTANQEKPLYSRRTKNNSGSTVQQVRNVLINRFGKETIDELERQGKLEIIQDYQVEGVEGFYYNGKAVLVASNLTAESTVPTFLHELGGHAGFQNMMNQKQYNELMNQFNKLVEQGNPVALAAKMLAEREQGSERQQLEYLPYLLTLSSTMQQRNVIQRNALQKLIKNIISYVKAWLFDNFGINLNLNPDDILALSERMIGQIKHQSSLDLIRQKYQGTSQWMTAPNGAKTHLSEQQWLQVRTSEFKKWFGDWENDASNASQVLDENGEPKVVYHGTATAFNEFKQGHGLLGDGIYLTDSFDTADMYANIRGNNGFVLPLFVNIRSAFKTSGNVSRDKVVEATRSGKYQGVVHQFDNQEYIVALESNQVKMAEGNTGTFNSESADIRFSRRSDQIKDMLNTIVSNMNKQGAKKVKQQASFKFDHALGYLLQGLGRRQLTDIYAKILPQLTIYNDLAAQMDADKNEAGARADEIVVKWAKVKDEQQLAELMHEATLAKIDPDKPYVSGDSVSKYKELRNDFSSLSPEAQSMYRQARDEYKKHHRDVLTAIKERIMRASIGNTKKAELMKQMDDNFFHGLKGVYFPLSRFGQYVVLVRDKNGVVESVNRAETRSEAEALHADLVKMFPNSKVEKVIRDKAFNASRDMVGRGFMTDLFDELDKFGLSTTKQAELEDILGQLYLSSLPDLSWAKHGIHRKGTAGFSQDARRAFAQNMFHGASYLAKLRYADVMVEQLDEMQKYADQRKNDNLYDQPVAQAVIDEMNSRHESLMSPDSNPLSSALTSLGFIYFLGLSVASGAVNLLQTVLVAYPQMGAKWGFDKAFAELNKAGLQSIKGGNDISKSLQGDELKAYNEAVRRGVIDVTQAHDLAGIAQGEDSGVMWKLRPIMRWASFIFHQAERFNREVTFVASYRLAKSTGVSHNIAFEQAMKATYDGHFDYSSGNRPRVMQGNVAKVILLFKQFGQNMIYTMLRSLHQTFKAETPAARKEAFRALTGIMGAHAVFAGTLGLPLISTLLGLISFFGGSDDEPWDAETALKNNLSDVLGVTVTDVLMNGVSRVTPWDISGRVSINNLIVPKTREGLEGESKAQAYMSAAVGPIGGIFINILKGFSEIADGHGMRGVETMSPTFLRGPLRAIRFADEGAQDKTGVSIQDDVGIAAILGQAAGFAPSDVRLATEGRSAVYDLQKKLDNRRSSLMTKFARAKLDDDPETMNEAWGEIEKFNQANPSRRINRIQAMQSYKKRKKRIDNAEHGMVVTRKKREDLDQGRFAYND